MLLLAVSFAAVRDCCRPEQVARALGLWNLLILVAFVLGSLVGVSHAVEGLWSPAFWPPTLAGLLLFAVHGAIETRRNQPIFPVALFRRGSLLVAIVSGIAWNFAQSVVQLQTSNFWQVVQHFRTSLVALGQLMLLGWAWRLWLCPSRRRLCRRPRPAPSVR